MDIQNDALENTSSLLDELLNPSQFHLFVQLYLLRKAETVQLLFLGCCLLILDNEASKVINFRF